LDFGGFQKFGEEDGESFSKNSRGFSHEPRWFFFQKASGVRFPDVRVLNRKFPKIFCKLIQLSARSFSCCRSRQLRDLITLAETFLAYLLRRLAERFHALPLKAHAKRRNRAQTSASVHPSTALRIGLDRTEQG